MNIKPGTYGGTVIPADRDGYAVVTKKPKRARLDGGLWFVVRYRDGRIMTEGSVITCLRWVNVWGPMYDASN